MLSISIREADGTTRSPNLSDLVGALTMDTVRYVREQCTNAGQAPGVLSPGAFIVSTGDYDLDIAWADWYNKITDAKPPGVGPRKLRPPELAGDDPPPKSPKYEPLSPQSLLDFYEV